VNTIQKHLKTSPSERKRYLQFFMAYIFAPSGLMRNCGWFRRVEKSFSTRARELLLTIDDGPDPRQTPQILDTLAKAQVQAVFFVIGKNVEAHPSLCRRMAEEGHSVQNHTYSHPSATFWSAGHRRAKEEIECCSVAIQNATGRLPLQFRAPVGLANPFVHLAAESCGLKMMGWSATGHDGITHNPACVVHRIRKSATPGGIVLVHESHLRSMQAGERACTLSELLNTLRVDGYKFTDRLYAGTS
jgi:peptidoglycan/xylan/chitin deacetylase (PgdA/CDA1 family)